MNRVFEARRCLTAALLAGAIAVPASAFAQADDATLQAAEAEGKVVVYTSQGGDLVEALGADFEARHPDIDVEIFHLSGAPLAERFFADSARGEIVADVITHGGPEMQEFRDAGLLAEYTNEDFTSHVAPERLGLAPFGYIDQFASGIVVYNTDNVTEEEAASIDDWMDLADPKWKGRMVIVDPNVTTSHFQYYVGLYSAMGPDAFKAWLTALAQNEPTILESNTPSVDGILRGEFDIGIITEGNAIRRMEVEGGPPLGIKYLSPTPAQYSTTALVNGAPHPNAGRVFIDYWLSKEGQELWMELDGSRSPRDDAVSPNSNLPGYVSSSDLELITWDDFSRPVSMRDDMLAIYNEALK